MNQPLLQSLSAPCHVAILIKQEHIPDCGAGPSLLHSDVRRWSALTPTLNDSQPIKSKGLEEHLELQHGFQTIKLPTASYKSWCGHESGLLLAKTQRPKCVALILPLDTEGGDGHKHAAQLRRLSQVHVSCDLLALF